jgi:hypothetical protein
MFGKILKVLNMNSAQDIANDFESRRSFPRRTSDKCVGLVDGKAMPVLDWSPGGLRLFGDGRTYSIGQPVDVMLKFHMNDMLIEVKHQAQIVRKSSETFAVQFAPLSADIRKTFQHVIDNFNADEFATSQA